MNQAKVWEVKIKETPVVLKNCPKCGGNSEFKSSNCFRVNANQNNIDVWLIYQCKRCKSTWNMDILTRVNKSGMEENLFKKFLDNDKELATRYAFDVSIHKNNKATLSYDNFEYEIIGDDIGIDKGEEGSNTIYNEHKVLIKCEYSFDLRLDKLISNKLGVSREVVKKMFKNNKIIVLGVEDIRKIKVKDGMIFTIIY